jgi:hypothetical protein
VELEQRVKTLEYEMKILKNEVQRTLLDIQEQVLVHYYPTLRTDESKPSEGTIKALEELRARQTGQPAAPTTPATPAPAAPTTPATSVPPPPPVIKKVSLEEIRAAQNELAAEQTQAHQTAAPKPAELAKESDSGSSGNGSTNESTAVERGSLKLLEWLMNSAAKVGNGRDSKQVNQVLDELTKLNALVDRAGNIEEALRLIEEAKLG